METRCDHHDCQQSYVEAVRVSNKMSEKLCLQWNDFKENVVNAFGNLRADNNFADVTLACEGEETIEAHKVILSACSPFFDRILKKNSHVHPLIFLTDVALSDLKSIINFMYLGQTNVVQEDLQTLQ